MSNTVIAAGHIKHLMLLVSVKHYTVAKILSYMDEIADKSLAALSSQNQLAQ